MLNFRQTLLSTMLFSFLSQEYLLICSRSKDAKIDPKRMKYIIYNNKYKWVYTKVYKKYVKYSKYSLIAIDFLNYLEWDAKLHNIQWDKFLSLSSYSQKFELALYLLFLPFCIFSFSLFSFFFFFFLVRVSLFTLISLKSRSQIY